MQISIAICDDEKIALQNMKNKIIHMSNQLKILPEIFTFDNEKRITELICNGKEVFDILFLDIDMPDIS